MQIQKQSARSRFTLFMSITDKRSIIHFILIIYLFNMHVSPLAFLNQINLSQLLLLSFW